MGLIEWSDALALGVDAMDATHREFVDQLNALHAAPDDGFVALLDRFIDHTVDHFEQERGWMAAIEFPPTQCHLREHEGVLEIMRDVRRMVVDGKPALGKVLTRELAPWFANHAATMDATLAFFLRCHAGGLDPMQELARRQQGLCADGACGQSTTTGGCTESGTTSRTA